MLHNKRLKPATHAGVDWVPEEDEFLRENYADKDNFWLARELGRSMHSVSWRARSLGLAKAEGYRSRNAIRSNHYRAKSRCGGLTNYGQLVAELKRAKAGALFPGCRTMMEVKVCNVLRQFPCITSTQIAKHAGMPMTSVYTAIKTLMTLSGHQKTFRVVDREKGPDGGFVYFLFSNKPADKDSKWEPED